MRAEALGAISTWAKPSVLDRVDGRYRGEVERDPAPVKKAIQPMIADLLQESEAAIPIATARVIARLQLKNAADALFTLFKSSSDVEIRRTSLRVLNSIGFSDLNQALELALEDNAPRVRSAALGILPQSNLPEEQTVQLFDKILKSGTIKEKQTVYAALGNLKGEASTETLNQSLDQLMASSLAPEIQLDLLEAVEQQGNTDLLAKVKTYQDAKPKDDPLALYRETLLGGEPGKGKAVFYQNEAAQCVRCHTIFEYGGNAGPGLAGVGARLSAEELLEALVAPSASYALGYEVVTLKLKNGENLAGFVAKEDESQLSIRKGKEDIIEVSKDDIQERKSVPSAMPTMGSTLTKKEIRDVIAFLLSLKEEG